MDADPVGKIIVLWNKGKKEVKGCGNWRMPDPHRERKLPIDPGIWAAEFHRNES